MDVKAERERLGVSQRDLSSKTGISQATLSRIESGERTLMVGEGNLIEMALSLAPRLSPTPDVPVLATPAQIQSRRRAFICAHATKGQRDCNRRVFLTPDEPDRVPDCPEHGVMVLQPNRHYRGSQPA
jgi:transcriptional regulator with XRE-family HTH domain